MPTLRDFLYLDPDRTLSLAAQLDHPTPESTDRATLERLYLQIEPVLLQHHAATVGPEFDYENGWTPTAFADGQFLRATGTFRLLDFAWLTLALSGLPAVLRKMSKLEMEALKNSDEGRRMSKQALQQRQTENAVAISKVEDFKADELGEVVGKLYGDVTRIKIRPSEQFPQATLIGSAASRFFYDPPAALSQKYGLEIAASWTTVGQFNVPSPAAVANPMPVGNKMEDAFEQIALLMNNAFKLANSPTFPAVSFTPIAIYRTMG